MPDSRNHAILREKKQFLSGRGIAPSLREGGREVRREVSLQKKYLYRGTKKKKSEDSGTLQEGHYSSLPLPWEELFFNKES